MRVGVLLFNLGGPETLEDVRPFLYNLFSDPEIIRIRSNALRKLLAWSIATMRQRKSRNLYRQIGGGSPLRKITEAQATALAGVLESNGTPARVYVGMRCWHPSIDEAVESILVDQIERLILLPLFPQYSVTTTGSCLKYFEALDRKLSLSFRMKISAIREWFNEPEYLDALARLIRQSLKELLEPGQEPVHLLYSAHSVPARYIEEEGDPYLEQTKQTVAQLNMRLGDAYPWTLAFQSKVGPVRWLEPATTSVLQQLGRQRIRSVLVIPVSFVSDHIETLQEIDIAYRELAAELEITNFRRVPSLNLDSQFIHSLSSLILRHL